MKNLMSHTVKACLIVLLCALSSPGQDKPQTLAQGSPIERDLAGGEKHTYLLNLKVNQIAQVIVEQRGIDVVVTVIGPDGKKLFDIDSPNGSQGDEPATIFATQDGVYRFEVHPLGTNSAKGRYQIRLVGFLTESEYMTERLAALGRLWGAMKFFHPFLAYKEIDWDGALVKAIPRVIASRNPDQYREAISEMLRGLDDPLTVTGVSSMEVGAPAPAPQGPNEKREPAYFRVVDGYVVVFATDWAVARLNGNQAAAAKQPQMMQDIGKAKGVVLDCRYRSMSLAELPPFYLSSYLSSLIPSLVHGQISLGTRRYRQHNGYRPQLGSTSGGYTSSLVTEAPDVINGQAEMSHPLSVLVDERTPYLVPTLSGLQAIGARIVRVGKTDDGSGASVYRTVLPDGVRVTMRTADFVHPNGSSIFRPDLELPHDGNDDEKVIAAAIATLAQPSGEKLARSSNMPVITVRGLMDEPYARVAFPSEEYRLLALFRFWNVIRYFHPYKLYDKPWDSVLTDFIPSFREDKSALEYQMTVAQMVARLQDSHGFVRGLQVLREHLGAFTAPLRLKAVGGKLAVVGFVEESPARDSGVKVGDVILAIDGEPAEKRIAYLTSLVAVSTPQAAAAVIYYTALRGAKDSKVRLRIEGADQQVREVEMTRSLPLERAFPEQRKTSIYEVLPSGYGYIDLARLPLAEAQKAMDAMMKAPAIIFDMRGYPNGTAWAIAPRLTEKKDVTAALFRRPLLSAMESINNPDGPDYSFGQKLPPAAGAIYKGKVVMLISEDAISQAEHTCMFFEAATDVTFIGMPTNGANGDVTNLVLPGGIYVNFSGHDVRHADGRQLQRVGIQPHIKVEPTIKGVREGRDEILEAAIKYLDSRR